MVVEAIISDIHANLRALEAVLDDIDRKGIKKIRQLGDIIGYGPNPRECFEIVSKDERIVTNLEGNHEKYFLELFKFPDMNLRAAGVNKSAAESSSWTRQQFFGMHPHDASTEEYREKLVDTWVDKVYIEDPPDSIAKPQGLLGRHSGVPDEQWIGVVKDILVSFLKNEKRIYLGYHKDAESFELGPRVENFFAGLEPSLIDGDVMYSHDNVLNPGDGMYTMDKKQRELFKSNIEGIVTIDESCEFAAIRGIEYIFLGHLHDSKIYELPKGYEGIQIVNVGSVGKPRTDPKKRASYVIFDRDEKESPVQLIYLDYPWRKTEKEMRKIPELSNKL